MKRRVLSTIIALLLVAALLPMSVLAASYTDTDGHWAESSIERWSDAGVVQGTGDAFAPDSDLTCAQLATILAKLLRLPQNTVLSRMARARKQLAKMLEGEFDYVEG